MRNSIPAVILFLTCAAGSAEAQNPPPTIAVGFGVGSMAPVATDNNGAFPFYAGSVRVNFRRHMGVEVEGTYKSDDAQYQWGPGRITIVGTDRTETIVPYAGATHYTSDSWWETTINLIARSTGRVAGYGGGGFGFGATKSEELTTYTGCSSPVCDNNHWSRTYSGITLGAIGGVDARIVNRVSGFGSLRATVGYTGRGADVAAMAGVRVRVM
jgi:hypothetical protein